MVYTPDHFDGYGDNDTKIRSLLVHNKFLVNRLSTVKEQLQKYEDRENEKIRRLYDETLEKRIKAANEDIRRCSENEIWRLRERIKYLEAEIKRLSDENKMYKSFFSDNKFTVICDKKNDTNE